MTERASAASVSKSQGAPDPLIGRVINDRFKINALIARGGMGKVYRAEQAPLGRVCAIKVLNPSYAREQDPEFHRRFFLEASIASKLTHPNTVTIFDYGKTEDEIYYMAMEYLEGHTLHRAIREAGHFPEERAAHVARQICRALREAHSLGVIHRDLKPANIFLVEHGDETDFVKVLDFGLVKNVSGDGKGEDLTQTGLFMGSPKYMAPEQIRGDKVDARTDIYALGIIMYEMITGKVPFDRPNSVNILMAHVNEDAPPLRDDEPERERVRGHRGLRRALHREGPGPALPFDGRGARGAQARRRRGPHGDDQRRRDGRVPLPLRLRQRSAGDGQRRGQRREPGVPLADGQRSGEHPVAARAAERLPRGRRAAHVPAARQVRVEGHAGRGGRRRTGQRRHHRLRRAQADEGDGRVAGNGPSTTSTTASMSTAPATETAAVVAPPPTAAQASLVKVRINSDPDGASVKEDGVELCSSTPCDILYKGADADPTKEHKLTLARNGFRNETKAVKVGDSPVTVKLTAAPAGPVYVRPQQPGKNDTAPVPTGYKNDIPY